MPPGLAPLCLSSVRSFYLSNAPWKWKWLIAPSSQPVKCYCVTCMWYSRLKWYIGKIFNNFKININSLSPQIAPHWELKTQYLQNWFFSTVEPPVSGHRVASCWSNLTHLTWVHHTHRNCAGKFFVTIWFLWLL